MSQYLSTRKVTMNNKKDFLSAADLEKQLKQYATQLNTKYIEAASDPENTDFYFYSVDVEGFDSQIFVPDLEYFERAYSREKVVEGYLTCLHEIGHNEHWEQIEAETEAKLFKEDPNWVSYLEKEKDTLIENITQSIFFGKDTLEGEYLAAKFAIENSLLSAEEMQEARNVLAVKLRTYVLYEYLMGRLNLDSIKSIDAVIRALDFADDAEVNGSFTEDDLMNLPQVRAQDPEIELYRRIEKDNIFKFKNLSNKYTDQIWNDGKYYAKLGNT